MKNSYLLAVALCAGITVAPVMAEEASDFHALSQVATNAAPMTQDQLAATEGGHPLLGGLTGVLLGATLEYTLVITFATLDYTSEVLDALGIEL